MEKKPKTPSRTRPEVFSGHALSPLTLSGYAGGKTVSNKPDSSVDEDLPTECQQLQRPTNVAALKESEE